MWDKNVDKYCTFCETEVETSAHLLYECRCVIQKVWKSLAKWLKYYTNKVIEFNLQLIILNNFQDTSKKDNVSAFVNTCILMAKQYIYVKKCQKGQLSFMEITTKIHQLYIDEKEIVKQLNIQLKHNRKWATYSSKQ